MKSKNYKVDAPENATAFDEAPIDVSIENVVLRFALERLRRDCLALFGVTVSTFDGATFGLGEEVAIAEVQEAIRKWQNRRVFPRKEGN
jgi:hypothetical protein